MEKTSKIRLLITVQIMMKEELEGKKKVAGKVLAGTESTPLTQTSDREAVF